MSGIGERDDAPEVEVEDGQEVETEVEETNEETEGEEEQDGDEPEGGEGEQELAPGAAPEGTQKPRSAATIAVQEAKRRAKDAEAESARARAELAEIQRERQGRQTAEQQRLEQERVALMAPDEKVDYLLKKQEEGFNARFGALQFQQADSADRTAFEGRCSRVPAFDAIRDDVEAALAKARQSGGNPSRETVATYLIGQRAIERASKGGKTKQAARGAQNVSRQTVKAPAGRSDVRGGQSRSGGTEAQARAQRLSNLEI